MHFELSVTMLPRRASPVWLELKRLQKLEEEELQHRDVELAKTSGEGEALCHQPVSHTRSCLHPGETFAFLSEVIYMQPCTLSLTCLCQPQIAQERTKIPQFQDGMTSFNDFTLCDLKSAV